MIIHMFFADSNVGLWDAKDPRLAEFLIELLDVRMHRNLPIQREVALDDSAMRFGYNNNENTWTKSGIQWALNIIPKDPMLHAD